MKQLLWQGSFLRSVGVLVVLEVFWFSLMYPLVPSTAGGLILELVVGLCLGLIIYVFGKSIVWLTSRTAHVVVYRVLATLMAMSVGVLVFTSAYVFRALLESNFRYFIFLRR